MRLAILITFLLTGALGAEPLLHSWLTELSGSYARIYRNAGDADAQLAVTTWSRGRGTQTQPTYAGIHEIAATDTEVYIRTTGLAFHTMGPWIANSGETVADFPSNRAARFRFPRIPDTTLSPKVATGEGAIGLFIDGVSLFDPRDGYSYDKSAGEDEQSGSAGLTGDEIWNRNAFVAGSGTFDPAGGHQRGNHHHYPANAAGLRHLLGDSVAYDPDTHRYSESFNGEHSPILGWVADGLPLYGPYGYSDPLDPTSGIRRMISGYQVRNGASGSTALASTGRTTLPAWTLRQGRSPIAGSEEEGPDITETYPLGHYIEDYAYKGDLGLLPGVDFDLDESNVRFCVTPEFPDGTWAYFTTIEADGSPAFPYHLARTYHADPTGGEVDSDAAAEAAVTWEGGPERSFRVTAISADPESSDVSISWSSAEGGQYAISRSDTLSAGDWPSLADATATSAMTALTDGDRLSTVESQFYRVEQQSIAPFDDTGYIFDEAILADRSNHNVLLIILDDWGIDASSLYNTTPGAELASMPTFDTLAASGLRFTRGYAQPICSPTRATLLTGRQPYQHGVGNPQQNNTLPASELTFPEIITAEAPAYGLASFGKWHLGSGTEGPFETGGWPNFTGTLQGGLPDYNSWERVKIEDGVITDDGTAITTLVTDGVYASAYATSVQVDEAVAFIRAQGDEPWIVWMGFNAPHDPFHSPPAELAPPGGYSTTGNTDSEFYRRMLEALDTEVARLLEAVDLDRTNIIVVGDNGTPNAVVQAPAGGIAGAKGSLTEGGIHVPFFATGPDVTQSGTDDTLVHVIDLFATILDIAGVNVGVATDGIEIHSRSLLPVFQGVDIDDRAIISEVFNLSESDGRSLISDDWPLYKLISRQDVTDAEDAPSYEMYEMGSEGVEVAALTLPPDPQDLHAAAYEALLARDLILAPASSEVVTLQIDLPSDVPDLINSGNGNIVRPLSISVGGEPATWDTGDITVAGVTTSAARVNEDGQPDAFSLVATFDLATSGLTSGLSYAIVVTFPGGGGRAYTATNTFIMP